MRGGALVMMFALASSGCSTANPAFDPTDDTGGGDTVSVPSTTSSSTSGTTEVGETGESDALADVADSGRPSECVDPLVHMIAFCLHEAELSQPLGPCPDYFCEPVKNDLMPYCLAGAMVGDFFAPTFGVDPRMAYFGELCPGPYDWCGDFDNFVSEAMSECFTDFQAGFDRKDYPYEDDVQRTFLEGVGEEFERGCPSPCDRKFELGVLPVLTAPTIGGNLVEELLANDALSGGAALVVERFEEGVPTTPFLEPFESVKFELNLVPGWVTLNWSDELAEKGMGCDFGYRNRAFIGVHHESQVMLFMSEGNCLGIPGGP